MGLLVNVENGNWAKIRRNFQRLGGPLLGPGAEPTFANVTITDLTAGEFVMTDADKGLVSLAVPILVNKGGTGLTTITNHGLMLGSGTDAVTVLAEASDGQLPIGSVGADPVLAVLTGTANQVNVANAAGSITLSTPQDIHTDATPTFASATLGSVAYPGIQTATEEPTGFVNHTATLSWNDANRTLTITGDHDIYIYGVKTTKTTDSIQIADTTGLHWIYYDAAGTLSEQIGAPGFDLPLMATVYWNTTPGFDKGMAGEERHSFKMDHVTHEYLHFTVGSRYRSGLAGTFDNTTITIEAGIWYDEDIEATPAQQTTCNVLYKNGSAAWEWDAGVSVYYKLNGADLRYNNGNVLADAGNNQYMAMWIFITNDISTPVIALMGQRVDTTIANARANNKYELLSLGDLPFEEMKLLYRVILRNTGTPPTYTEALDMRSVSNLSTGTYIATAHSTLTGLTSGDDHSQYLLADGTRVLAGAWDMGSQALTNVNIDSGVITGITDLAVADGGTGASNAGDARTNLGLGTGDHPQFDGLGLGEAGVLGQIQVTSDVNTIQRIDIENINAGNVARAGFIARSNAAQFVMDAFGSGHGTNANDVWLEGISSTTFLIWARQIGDAGDIPEIDMRSGSSHILLTGADSVATITGAELCLSNFHELRFYDDGANYVGFEAPALTANKIWVLPNADGGANELLKTDGAGNLSWTATAPPGAHVHDGDTLEFDAINSDGGAFAFDTTGAVTFSEAITMSAGKDLTIAGHIIFNTNNSYVGFASPRITFNDTSDRIETTGAIMGDTRLYLLERADDAGAQTIAGYGQLWVKNEIPNELWFTDDAGGDVQLGIAALLDAAFVGQTNIVTVGTIATGVWEATDVGIAYGGTGQSTAQAAIDALSAVGAATNEHVLTKDTVTGNAIWKVAAGGGGAHTHDGDTLQLDGVSSDGGAFAFSTSGAITFNAGVQQMSYDSSLAAGTVAIFQIGNASSSVTYGAIRAIGNLASRSQIQVIDTRASSSIQGGGYMCYSDDGAAMASGDRLGYVLFGGSKSAAGYANAAGIASYASENWVDGSAYGAKFQFETVTNGATSRTAKLIINNDGKITMGTTAPSIAYNQLHLKTGTDGYGITIQRDSAAANTYTDLRFLMSTSDSTTPVSYIRVYRRTGFADNDMHFVVGETTALVLDDNGTITIGEWAATDIAIAHGGTGQSTAQAAIDALSDVAGGGNEEVLTKDTGTGNAIWKAASGSDSEKVKVDVGATADYLGAAAGDGALRVSTGLKYTDGGNFVTLGLDVGALTEITTIDAAADFIPVLDDTDSVHKKIKPTNLGHRFVDRGDPATYDWYESGAKTVFNTDETWRDLDCSAIVPVGATAIMFRIVMQDDVASSYFSLRKNGNSQVWNNAGARTQAANVYMDNVLICPCDSNRFVEYWGTNVAFAKIYLTVMGWWV